MTKNIYIILILIMFGISAGAQEVLTMPAFNPAVARKNLEIKKSTEAATVVTLPFYDDFSVISVYPSPLRWADKFAFVNTDYAKYPPSIGVATLDALDENGALYPNAGPNPFEADYLTSQPIRLDSLFTPVKKAINRSDNVTLSFFYQPQGRSISPPSKKASLILEFHSPGDYDTIINDVDTTLQPHWNQVWSTEGGIQVDTFAKPDNQYFKQIQIPINTLADSILYYKNGFQFRFRNMATLAGNSQPDWRNNGSHWNIDIVWLNAGQLTLKDIAFGDAAPSMLREYQAMPFSQYRQNFLNEMKENINIAIANLDNADQNVTYKYEVSKNSLAPFTDYDGGSYTINPFFSTGYTDYIPFAKPPINFFYPISNEEKVVFHILHTLTPDPNPQFQSNDSVQFDQMFSNYYAYDNGTAEAGVGINGAAGSYAVKFKLNETDTLRGIQIYFNPVINGSNTEPIDLNVWNDAFGTPGQVVKSLNNVDPIYSTSLNEFYTYWFETPLAIDPLSFPGLIFYIGWTQTSVNNLNVGFDRYTDSHLKRYYNVTGTWEGSDSINYGSLLMRPIVGPANPVGVPKPAQVQTLSFLSNPVTDGWLNVQLPDLWKNISQNNLDIKIINGSGSCLLSGTFSNPVDVSMLAPGFYMVILTDNKNGRKLNGKIIKK